MSLFVLTEQEAEDLALADFGKHLGAVIEVYELTCVIAWGPEGVQFDRPILARVIETPRNDIICRWNDNRHIDPYWNIQLLESMPEVEECSSYWINGRTIDRRFKEPQDSGEWKLDRLARKTTSTQRYVPVRLPPHLL